MSIHIFLFFLFFFFFIIVILKILLFVSLYIIKTPAVVNAKYYRDHYIDCILEPHKLLANCMWDEKFVQKPSVSFYLNYFFYRQKCHRSPYFKKKKKIGDGSLCVSYTMFTRLTVTKRVVLILQKKYTNNRIDRLRVSWRLAYATIAKAIKKLTDRYTKGYDPGQSHCATHTIYMRMHVRSEFV